MKLLRKEQWVVLLIGFPVIVFFLWEFVFSALYFKNKKTPDHYILASDFSGWAVIKYSDPSCAPLPKEKDTWIYTIPKSGLFCTSNKPEQGWSSNTYSYTNDVSKNLKQNPKTGANHIWHEDQISYQNHPYYLFYVAPKKINKTILFKQEPIIQAKLDLLTKN